MTTKTDGGGLRYNEGKNRVDLVPSFAIEQMARVFTAGAKKYEPNNWRRGMKWSVPLSSCYRHILAYEKGEDFDKETGILHLAHAATNLAFILEYYNTYPEGDDRQQAWKSPKRVALDVDDVLADFVGGVMKRSGLPEPTSWTWSYSFRRVMAELLADDNFVLGLSPKISPMDLPFEPVCYITSRTTPLCITEEWIEKNGFPCSPVIHTSSIEEKVETAKNFNVDIFVDDRYDIFVAMNNAGITCYLMDMPHNRRYDVGYLRIKSLSELSSRC